VAAPAPPDRTGPADRSTRADHFARAAELIIARQPAAAEAIFRDLLTANPADPEALHSLALICLATNRAAQAVLLLADAAAAAPTSAAIAAKLGQALAQIGRHADALASLDRAIALNPTALDPALADAHDTRGTVLLAEQRPTEALAAFDAAVALRPTFTEALANRGRALLQLGRAEPALAAFTAAIALNPALPELHLNRGIAFNQLARHADALIEIDCALSLEPLQADVSNMRGIVLLAMARLPEALSGFARAVALRPDFVDALYNQGTVLTTLGHHADAVASFDRVLALRPQHVDALLNRGNALLGLGRIEEGLASYCAVQALVPDHRDININIGNALQLLGRHAEALTRFDVAAALVPGHAAPSNSRGNALIALDRAEPALAAYERALTLDPMDAELHYNRANALLDLERIDAALASYDQALALRPNFAEALLNRGAALQRLGRHAAALDDFVRVQALRPEPGDRLCADSQLNESLSRLALGDYPAGWRKYERRWDTADLHPMRRAFAASLWLGGTDLEGRTLLAHAEQGFGDTLQFCRYLLLLPPTTRIVFEVQRPLLRLMASLPRALKLVATEDATEHAATASPPAFEVLSRETEQQRAAGLVPMSNRSSPQAFALPHSKAAGNEPKQQVLSHPDAPARLPPFDLHCPLLSLPLACGTTLETIPRRVPYLAADPTAVGPWRARLAPLPGLWIGICWAGEPRYNLHGARAVDRRRSTHLASWAPLAAVRGISLVSLQKGPAAEQLAQPPAGMTVHDWTDKLDDFADTAALIEALDLVITVDTAVAHLAGALGMPVWILNRYDACWRWLVGRNDSPWYPTATLFRQPRPGDWDPVFRNVAAALRDVMAVPARCLLIPAGNHPGRSRGAEPLG